MSFSSQSHHNKILPYCRECRFPPPFSFSHSISHIIQHEQWCSAVFVFPSSSSSSYGGSSRSRNRSDSRSKTEWETKKEKKKNFHFTEERKENRACLSLQSVSIGNSLLSPPSVLATYCCYGRKCLHVNYYVMACSFYF